MIDIKVFKDGKLNKVYENVQTHFEMINNCDEYDVVNLNFTCSGVTEYNESKAWSGKIICIANRGTYRFTPGKVYKVTETDVYDDTHIPFRRRNGPDCMFSIGTFKDLQNDFLRQGIDTIEYKGGAEE